MALGCWGIASGVGMLLLRRWARFSTLVFSVATASWVLLAAPAFLFFPIPIPPDIPEEAIAAVRSFLPVVFALLFAFAFWCIYLLNRDSSKSSFELPTTARNGGPVSIAIIGGFLMVTTVLGVESIASHGPAMLFGSVFTGWKAATIWLLASAAELYLGIGLLRRNPRSCVLAVCFFLFQFLETVAFLVRPDRESRIADYYHALHAYFQRRPGMQVSLNDVYAYLRFGHTEWGILCMIALWYLVRFKKTIDADEA